MSDDASYAFLQELVREETGLDLDDGKRYLVESRLSPVAAELDLDGIDELLRRLRTEREPSLVRRVCEAMVTNETLFFRDEKSFRALRELVLPELVETRSDRRKLSVWSAAASTGQELYSLALVLRENFPSVVRDWRLDLLGTDYCREALEQARRGRYNHFEVQRGLPVRFLVKYFEEESEKEWRVSRELRELARWEEANLLDPFHRRLGSFDLVLCRNVLLYFDLEERRDVMRKLLRVLRPDGFLMMGSSESAAGVTDELRRVEGADCSLYRPVGAPLAQRSEAATA